ncbi:MAG: DEAD/DEAH box helicase family protein, partial [Cyanobacteria bacterium REEB65]|nr:DEAD/DEAH box helicase family protein [Cyanobacteria bacterium REEB65]
GAFRETCQSCDIPCAVEVSRSGNGAHAWFFFSAPVPAVLARRMGNYLLTLTTSRRDHLSLKSYDRLFPNQDTLPEGGFGNLIALPLQGHQVPAGRSVFVNEDLRPISDQWAYLREITRVSPATVAALADLADRKGLDYGFLPEVPQDEDAPAPWERPPSGRLPQPRIDGPLPASVRGVLAQRLFIARDGLPPALLDLVRRLAAFKNPVFFRNQRFRKSNHNTPALICCAQEHPGHIGLPRGCLEAASKLLADHGLSLEVEDRRFEGSTNDWTFSANLRPLQQQAVTELGRHDIGIFVAPPGTGKTIVGVALIAARRCPTLVIVHRKTLLEQWRTQLAMWLGIERDAIGVISGTKRKATGLLDVAMVQSLVRQDEVDDLVARYGHVVVDECHHIPAVQIERVVAEAKAKYVLGLTATPFRQDGHHPILHWHCGPTRFEIKPSHPEARPPYRQTLVCRSTSTSGSEIETGTKMPA